MLLENVDLATKELMASMKEHSERFGKTCDVDVAESYDPSAKDFVGGKETYSFSWKKKVRQVF